MTGQSAPRVFVPRTLLGHLPVDRVSLRTASADAHHVAKVHGRYGVATGLVTRVTDGQVEVSGGEAFTARGDYVVLRHPVRLDPPADPGWYRLWLDPDARVTARPASRTVRPSDVPIALVRAVPTPSGAQAQILWTPPVSLEGRALVPAPARPHVGSGRELLTLDDVVVDEARNLLERRVRTADAGFARTPFYFASVSLRPGPEIAVRSGRGGWFTRICHPTPTGFTLTLFLQTEPWARGALTRAGEAGQGRAVLLEILWTGVDTRREQDIPADPDDCSDKPPLPHIEIG